MKTKVINISLPNQLLSEADRIAKDEYRSRSELFREAIRDYIVRQSLVRIYRAGAKQAVKKGIQPEDINRLISEYRQGK